MKEGELKSREAMKTEDIPLRKKKRNTFSQGSSHPRIRKSAAARRKWRMAKQELQMKAGIIL